MGGHGLYVWSAYALAVVIIAYNIIAPIRHRQRIRVQVQRQDRLDAARKKQAGSQRTPELKNAVGGSQ